MDHLYFVIDDKVMTDEAERILLTTTDRDIAIRYATDHPPAIVIGLPITYVNATAADGGR